jgi:hypothetical protein
MFKTRVKFTVKESDEIQIGYLVRDKQYKYGYKVRSGDKKSSYCISLLSMIETI